MRRLGYLSFKRVCIAALLAAPMLASAYTFTQPFSYFANRHSLNKVLTSFAKSQGMKAEFTDEIKGKISGRFRDTPPSEFLAALADAYDVGYFVLGKQIYFYNLSKTTKDFLTVRRGEAQSLVESLRNSGLLAEELPVTINKNGSMLTIEGPEAYVENLKSAAKAYEAVLSEKIAMRVFRLKHAWADDVDFTSMDKTITVPGVASVLRALVMGQSLKGQNTVTKKETNKMTKMGSDGVSASSKKKSNPTTDTSNTPISSGNVSIMADTRLNAVLVSDASYRMPYYEQVIGELDKPVELVEIHAAIVDINAGSSRELGVNFGGSLQRGKWAIGGASGNPTTEDSSGNVTNLLSTAATAAATGGTGALLSTVYQHGSDTFMAKITALEENNKARILGRPSVLTVDNVQASLENTTTYYVKLEGKEAVDLVKVEAGTVLRVTPHIIRENGKTSIKLAVNVQDDQQSSGTSTDTGSALPPVKQTKINTQAVIDAGQSLLIGGYYYERKEDSESGIPILKDIPLFGNLFKTSGKRGEIVERLILITPRLVTPVGDNTPSRVDKLDFGISPSQSDYRMRSEVQAAPPADSRQNLQQPVKTLNPVQSFVEQQPSEVKTAQPQSGADQSAQQDWEKPANLKAPRTNRWGYKPWSNQLQNTNPWRGQP